MVLRWTCLSSAKTFSNLWFSLWKAVLGLFSSFTISSSGEEVTSSASDKQETAQRVELDLVSSWKEEIFELVEQKTKQQVERFGGG